MIPPLHGEKDRPKEGIAEPFYSILTAIISANATNMIKKSKGALSETWTFEYDHDNHMIGAEKRATDGGVLQMKATYVYDALRNRIEKQVVDTSTTTTTRFSSDGGDIMFDLDGTNAVVTRYVHGDRADEWLVRVGSGADWYLVDRQGTVRDIQNNASGLIIDKIGYNAYGQVTSETAPVFGGRVRHTGRELDGETGFQFHRARYYDPSTGRWMTEDPSRWGASDVNIYRYIGNNPTSGADPSGLEFAGPRYYPFGGAAQRHLQQERRAGQFTFNGFTDRERILLLHDIDIVTRAAGKAVIALITVIRTYSLLVKARQTKDWEDTAVQKHLSLANRWFTEEGGGLITLEQLRAVRDVMQKTLDGIRRGPTKLERRSIFSGELPPGIEADPGDIVGKVEYGSDDLGEVMILYDVFYKRPAWGRRNTLFHELTHYYANTRDYAYVFDANPDADKPVYEGEKKLC